MPNLFNLFGNNQPAAKTKDGEITINLNLILTLKLEQDGTVRLVSGEAGPTEARPIQAKKEKDHYESPFLGNEKTEIIDFGKQK